MSETQAWYMLLCAVFLGLLVVSDLMGMLLCHLDERAERHRRLEHDRDMPRIMSVYHEWMGGLPRIIRDGRVNPKPAGPAPPLPVQRAKET